MKSGIKHAVGKTISGAISVTNDRPPREQLFIEFSDGTYLEVYGELFSCANGVDKGGREVVERLAGRLFGKVKREA